MITYAHKGSWDSEQKLIEWQRGFGPIHKMIEEGECINCERGYKKDTNITFATTSNGKVVWWHNFRCK